MTKEERKGQTCDPAAPENAAFETVHGAFPLVSVIIPVYNAGPYLKETMDCITGQDCPDMEIICVNDGSTDNSREILSGYEAGDPRVRVIDQENSGLSEARNSGIRAARGKYLNFLDSDDLLEPGTMALLTAEMERRDLDYLCFKAEAFTDDPDCQELTDDKNINYLRRELDEDRVFTGPELLIEWNRNPANRYNAPACFCMIRRAFLAENQLFFIPKLLYEDEVWTFSVLLRAKRAGCLNQSLYRYRIHNASIVSGNTDFSRAYSLYRVFHEYYKASVSADPVCGSELEEVLLKHRQRIQKIGIQVYRQCSEEEKNKRLLLPIGERWGFETVIGFPASQTDRLEEVKNESKAQKEELQNEIGVLKSSTSYRFGRACTRIPGMIKDLLRFRSNT